jgi:hypothetical protein
LVKWKDNLPLKIELLPKEIIKIDATLIAGVLILLSISSGVTNVPQIQFDTGNKTIDRMETVNLAFTYASIDAGTHSLVDLFAGVAVAALAVSTYFALNDNARRAVNYLYLGITIVILFSFGMAWINYGASLQMAGVAEKA